MGERLSDTPADDSADREAISHDADGGVADGAGGGYWQLIRTQRPFRFLWFGQIVSLFGDWFNLIASAALLSSLTGTGVALGGLIAIRMLAPFLASPIAGVIGDRYNRKRILVATDVLRAVTVLGFLLVRDANGVWLLFALTAVQLGISGVFFPIRTAILPDIVPQRMLGAANALSSATWSVMLAVGAAAGGLFAGLAGVYPAFLLDAATFVLSAVLIARVAYRAPRPVDPPPAIAPDADTDQIIDGMATDGEGVQPLRAAQRASAATPSATGWRGTLGRAARDYVEGLRYLVGVPATLLVAVQKAFLSLFFSGFQVATIAIASSVYPIGEGGGVSLGLVLGVAGVGSGIAPILARLVTGDRPRRLRVAIVFGYLMATVGLGLTAPLLSFSAVLVGATLRGVGAGIVWVFTTQLLLQRAPERLRGRIFAAEHAGMTLFGAAGAAGAGAALEMSAGISGALWALVAFSLVPVVIWSTLR